MRRLVPGRCRSTNQCAYCARLAAVENAECLAIDAMRSAPPALWAVLTTRSTDPDPASFYRSREAVMAALKRRWPDVECCCLVEFTTGYGRRSGRARRPHWNLLLKGIPAEDVDQVRDVVAGVWCRRVDALPAAQYVGTVAEAGGLMRYLALHFQKESQAPPAGWRGHRFTHSRGYFAEGIQRTRELARDALRYRRQVWKLERQAEREQLDMHPADIHDVAAALHEAQEQLRWQLVREHELAAPPAPVRHPWRGSHPDGARGRRTDGRSGRTAARQRARPPAPAARRPPTDPARVPPAAPGAIQGRPPQDPG